MRTCKPGSDTPKQENSGGRGEIGMLSPEFPEKPVWRMGLVLTVVVLLACAGSFAGAGETPRQAGEAYFVLPENEKRLLIEGLKTIALGDSWNDVAKTLGKPDLDYGVAYKETGLFKVYRRVYNVYKISDGANTNDEIVILYFDKQNILIAIFSTIKEYRRQEMNFE